MLFALVSAARSYGVDANVESLRRSYVVAGEVPTNQLIAIARDLGLQARAIRIRWQDLPRLQRVLPAIIRLRNGHALVLEAIIADLDGDHTAIIRNAAGAESATAALQEEQLAPIWDGEIILLKRSQSAKAGRIVFGVKWLFGQVMREQRLFRNIMLASFFTTIFTIAPSFMVWIVLDRVLVSHSTSTLSVVVGIIAFLILFEMLLSYISGLFTEVAATRIDSRLNLFIMERLLKLPMDFFERTPTGVITSKLGQIWQVRGFLTGQLFGTVMDLIPLIVLVPVLFIINWKLAILVVATITVIFIVVALFMQPLGLIQASIRQAENDKSGYLIETLYGMRTIKSLVLERRRRNEWDHHVAEAVSARYAFESLANWPQSMIVPLERLIWPGTIIIGAFGALSQPNMVGAGGLMAFAMLAGRTAAPMIKSAVLLRDIGDFRGTMADVSDVMNVPAEGERPGLGLRLPIRGHIQFQAVRFRYTPETPLALDQATLEIRPGTIFGIMGRSGSGKTTITRLLQGLNPVYEGSIKIDGMDLREIDLAHLRTNISVVPQENFLFTGTIRENIGVARPDASFAEIVRAAQLAGAEEFIERMPQGYDTMLQEGATNLSGGQRQRLAIARALVIDPPVMILDEATSALDPESEAIINANLLRIARDRTIICVSHRLSMLVPADAILVMERGRVYDIGRHEELLHRCDIYKHMWNQQNRHSASRDEQETAHAPLALPHTATL